MPMSESLQHQVDDRVDDRVDLKNLIRIQDTTTLLNFWLDDVAERVGEMENLT